MYKIFNQNRVFHRNAPDCAKDGKNLNQMLKYQDFTYLFVSKTTGGLIIGHTDPTKWKRPSEA